MKKYDDQIPNSYTDSIRGYSSLRKRTENKPPPIITFRKRARTYPPLTAADRREQLFGPGFNYVDTTLSVARPVGKAQKSTE